MKKIILILLVLPIFLCIAPNYVPAEPISKNSVLLKEIRELKTPDGVLFAKESIYAGGISGNRLAHDSNGQGDELMLRELRAPHGVFTLSGGEIIDVKVIPTVARKSQSGVWSPALGKWEFKFGETNNYKSAIHVKKAGDLDIAYQSTGMRVGEEENVMHFGLSGNPHAVTLSKKRLKKVFGSEEFTAKKKPNLFYQPPNETILVQLEVTAEGLIFRPILTTKSYSPRLT